MASSISEDSTRLLLAYCWKDGSSRSGSGFLSLLVDRANGGVGWRGGVPIVATPGTVDYDWSSSNQMLYFWNWVCMAILAITAFDFEDDLQWKSERILLVASAKIAGRHLESLHGFSA